MQKATKAGSGMPMTFIFEGCTAEETAGEEEDGDCRVRRRGMGAMALSCNDVNVDFRDIDSL
jgi:hypothetical protein